jgi:hypothetical protein
MMLRLSRVALWTPPHAMVVFTNTLMVKLWSLSKEVKAKLKNHFYCCDKTHLCQYSK